MPTPKPSPLFEQRRSLLDRTRVYIAAVAVPIALFGGAALVIEYGFAPDAANQAVLHIIQHAVLMVLVAQLLITPILARPVREYLRRRWYHYALLGMLGITLALLRLSSIAEASTWMLRAEQVFLAASFLFRAIELNQRISVSRLRPAQILVATFGVLIAVGTGLLMLPAATAPEEAPTSITSALFTATSAVCVTGVIVENTGTHWSTFGQTVILVLIQLGGLGIMTFGSIFAMMLWRGMGIRETVLMRDVLSHDLLSEISRVVIFILLVTFCFEALGAVLLLGLWNGAEMGLGERIYQSVFHSISGFCNAGFSLHSDSFSSPQLRFAWQTHIVLAGLVICGGLGFVVLFNLTRAGTFRLIALAKRLFGHASPPDFKRTRLSLQTKIVLLMTLALLVLGTGLTFVFESLPPGGAGQSTSAMSQAPWQERLTDSYFLSVTSRTAGFNTTPTSDLAPSTKFFTIVMMVIGASPGSTGGGIKTVTLAIILCSIWSLARGYHQPQAFKRTIHHILVLRAMTVMALAVAVIVVVTMAISAWGMKGSAEYDFLDVLFETTSAFGTVGLTTGHTGSLNGLGRLLVIVTMIVGRLGPLTIFVALPTKESARNFDYPLESVAIG